MNKQREIKFRAWDKENKRMFLFGGHWFITGGDGVKLSFSQNKNYGIINNLGFCEIMQFTGLFDKNGKEIYEGDIVITKGRTKELIGIIAFRPNYGWISRWKYHYPEEKGVNDFFSEGTIANHSFKNNKWIFECNESIEVIGNKFEHPELLK